MSLTEAGKLAPDAVYLPTRGDTYSDYAERVREIARCFSPVVQVASIDEMYLDLSGCERLYRQTTDETEHDDIVVDRAVGALTTRIADELGLPSSAGISCSRVVSKVASAMAKPRGVMLIPAGVEAAVLAPLPVRAFPGIGPVAEAKLHELGLRTLGEVARTPPGVLAKVFGAWAPGILRGLHGKGSGELGRERPAFSEHDPEGESIGSISNERTFREDIRDPASIESVLCGLCERVCWRARKRVIKARTVTLKLRYADFHTITRSRTLGPTDSELELFPVVRELLAKARTRNLPVRLLGLRLSNLGVFEQLDLFEDDSRVLAVVDDIRDRYGFSMMALATQLSGVGRTVVSRTHQRSE
jgi:DNA polymerase-4